MAATANFQAPWPFASVWQLVKDFAKMNCGKDYQEYPIYSVDPTAIKLKPNEKLNSEDAEKFNQQMPRHQLLEAFWRCCFYVCEKYTTVSEDELNHFLDDPQLEKLVTNLCCQLRPVCEFYPDHEQSMLSASLQATRQAVNVILNESTLPAPSMLTNRASSQSTGGQVIATRILSKLDLVSHLWVLQLEQWKAAQEGNPLPFRGCEGDDLGFLAYSNPTTLNDVLVYRFYVRDYMEELEDMLVSLKALLFHIMDKLPRKNKSIMLESECEEGNIDEFKLCWRLCESLKALTYRTETTQEGWLLYELREEPPAPPELERIYEETGLLTWESNAWGEIHAYRCTPASSRVMYQSTPSSSHIRASTSSSALKSTRSDNGTPAVAEPLVLNKQEVQPHTSDITPDSNRKSGNTTATGRKGSLPKLVSDGPALIMPPMPKSWGSLLSPPNRVSAPRPPVSPAHSANIAGNSLLAAESKPSLKSTCEPSDNQTLDQVDVDDLNHIRIRILLRAAAAKDGWHPQLGISLADFVRNTMSATTFGKTTKCKKLFMDYRSAVVDPQNNIKVHGDMAAHCATAAQIKRAVEWKTAAGKHQYLKDLFRAVTGLELDQVDDETDLSFNA
ncbi:hypothetical protein BDZ91DRAFT_729939 [Kalaharituber pfeilii]|nr:hypothetical protein BDZ91DRAFT_729939 [Kalaharituber pfeilii]